MAKKTSNPFLDQDFSQFFDARKFAEQFQVPGVDYNALIEAHRRNIETVTQANRVAFEGAQALAQRQTDIMQEAMREASQAMQDVRDAGSPEERVAKQSEIAKTAFETALKNARELAEMSAKSNTEAMELVNSRLSENFDEMRRTMEAIAKRAPSESGKKS